MKTAGDFVALENCSGLVNYWHFVAGTDFNVPESGFGVFSSSSKPFGDLSFLKTALDVFRKDFLGFCF